MRSIIGPLQHNSNNDQCQYLHTVLLLTFEDVFLNALECSTFGYTVTWLNVLLFLSGLHPWSVWRHVCLLTRLSNLIALREIYYVGTAPCFAHTPDLPVNVRLRNHDVKSTEQPSVSKLALASIVSTMAAVDSFQFLYREISRSCSFYFETLALVGALYTASRAVILVRDCCTLVRVHFLPRMIPTKRLTQRFGDWAVIYGKECSRTGECIIL